MVLESKRRVNDGSGTEHLTEVALLTLVATPNL